MQPQRSPQDKIDCAFVTFYFPPCVGGLENYLERLASVLSERISICVLAPKMAGTQEIDDHLPFPVVRRPMLAGIIFGHEYLFKPLYPFAGLLIFFGTVVSFWKRRPKVICAASLDFAWAVAAAAALLGVEFCWICFAKDAHINPGLLPMLGKKLPLHWVMNRSRICFSISRFTTSILDPTGKYTAKIKLLYPPIEKLTAVTKEEIESARRIIWGNATNEGEVILSVGRLRDYKGFQHVIGALARLKSEFPRARYVVVGPGPYESDLKQAAKSQGVADRVVFAGAVASPEPYYALATVFATVSWPVPGEVEGFGMVYLEAARHGVPSIAGKAGGMPEAVLDGKTGYCVAPASSKEIADALRRLLGDRSLREKMGAAAREYAQEFEPDRIAEQFIEACGL